MKKPVNQIAYGLLFYNETFETASLLFYRVVCEFTSPRFVRE
jgi:hypothetical protein